MSDKPTTQKTLYYVHDTEDAWRFARTERLEAVFWVPKSVVARVEKSSGTAPIRCTVWIHDWWLEKNPLPKVERTLL